MEPTKPSSIPSTNPPSVEAAYKRKCIALKKRLGEIEDENELMRVRNKRGWQYIQKMRLESCVLLERLAESTGMGNELDVSMGGPDAEYERRLARATARMKYGNLAASGSGEPSYLGDETEGSSEEQPLTPQPQERPLRIKRPRKENEKDNEGVDEQGSTPGQQPSASTDQQAAARRPTQDEMTSLFRVQTGSNGNGNGNEDEAPTTAEKDETNNVHPSEGAAQEPASNGTAPETTDSQQQQQQQEQQQAPPPEQSGPAPVPEDNTTTPMDMDTAEEQKES